MQEAHPAPQNPRTQVTLQQKKKSCRRNHFSRKTKPVDPDGEQLNYWGRKQGAIWGKKKITLRTREARNGRPSTIKRNNGWPLELPSGGRRTTHLMETHTEEPQKLPEKSQDKIKVLGTRKPKRQKKMERVQQEGVPRKTLDR